MKKIKLLGIFVAFLLSVTTPISSVGAITGSDFNAGRIMDDQVFFDANSMSASEIQAFLNARVPECDTNGTKTSEFGGGTRAQYGASRGNPAPYICLKDYQQQTPEKDALGGVCAAYGGGTKTAAQIVKDVSTACGINPRLLLVELQTQQGLVTDDWPWPTQYKNAMGFACPDTTSCEVDYSGFFNQVYNAARLLKTYTAQPNDFRHQAQATSYIQFNPNLSCGGADVYLTNQATAALYNYSPYQPNASALANLWGTGDQCSAYQNRNLWRYFNEWFGSTLVTQPTANLTLNGQEELTVDYGSKVDIAWTSSGATTCAINPGNFTGVAGSDTLASVTRSLTYEMTCSLPSGAVTDTAILTVNPPTFAYVESYIESLSAKNQALRPIAQQVQIAQDMRARGDIPKSKEMLDKAGAEVDKLIRHSKLSAASGAELKQTLIDLGSSL